MRAAIMAMLLAVGLVGCGPQYQTTYQYQPPNSVGARQCLVQCQGQRDFCRERAQDRYENCRAARRQEAYLEYRAYLREMERERKRPSYSLSSFDRSYQCSTATAGNCTASYNECYQTCGGRVTARTVCVSNCDEAPPATRVAAAPPRPMISAPQTAAPPVAATPRQSMAPASILGSYQVSGADQDGEEYEGTVTITRRGAGYAVSWNVDDETYGGTGTLNGDRFTVESKWDDKKAIFTFTINDDGSLSGSWTQESVEGVGTEVWRKG